MTANATENGNRQYFGINVRRLRLAAGLTVAELEALPDIGHGSVLDIENGNRATHRGPQTKTLNAFARALGVVPAVLLAEPPPEVAWVTGPGGVQRPARLRAPQQVDRRYSSGTRVVRFRSSIHGATWPPSGRRCIKVFVGTSLQHLEEAGQLVLSEADAEGLMLMLDSERLPVRPR